MITLVDLLIHSDWLDDNDINNTVYKLYLNLLRTKLRRNDQFGEDSGYDDNEVHDDGDGCGAGWCIACSLYKWKHVYEDDKGNGNGDGVSGRCGNGYVFNFKSGDGFGYGNYYGYGNSKGNGQSI